jgi:predicted SprT family Zn-dependent metalloprotease
MSNQSIQQIQQQKQYTQEFYTNLQTAYNYFNEKLFQSELPQCMVTLNRKNNAKGYFCPQVFAQLTDPLNFIAEISLNPDHFTRPIKEILSTLVHKMCHLWCEIRGYKSRKGFHSKQWVIKMKEIGLTPIDKNGVEKESAAQMTHKINEGDLFDTICDKLLEEIKFDLVNLPNQKEKKEKEKTRFKYFCENNCDDAEFTGKRDLKVICASCGGQFLMEE